jgi:mRNA interferase RelE/StbE
MTLKFTENFDRKYAELDAELDAELQQAIDESLELFLKNPKTKSLRVHKMHGYKGVFEMSATMDIRLTYNYEKPDTVVLRNCGHHDKILKKP